MEHRENREQPVHDVQAVSVGEEHVIDRDQLAILLQRRYNILQEILRLTKELGEAFDRRDEVSEQLVLQMRSEQLQKAEQNWTEILLLGESSRKAGTELQFLLHSDPEQVRGESIEEERVFRVRRHLRELIAQVQEKDRQINTHMTREKSFYNQGNENES